ncbi:hypothetical protein LBK6_07840 [Leptospira borgpetersenii serovar Hardjo]|nr:hypothetical protein LBK6_07840 [Leptospira borgpetersenii serovar Hardjo]AMX61504.1 hypothetical protein LBK9_07865 [Leptospira borgpetersenii serovar Hardjo]AMX64749.1 hypothetical protein LBK30_07920 [Leptospira borgpetersenii serovar Hardjo]AMX67959.1 hypothetical protein LBHA_07745 [Leptospira borgpetersenii serovar Hardjo]
MSFTNFFLRKKPVKDRTLQLDYSDNVNWSFKTRCKVFKDIAQRGKSSTGWFYGFKLHLIINDQGELLSFMVTPGNVDDRNLKVIFPLSKNIYGKLFGDRGYISQSLFESLYEKGIQLITKLKKNMKNKLMPLEPVSKLVVLLNRNYLLVKWTNIIQRSPMDFGKK